jgi:hypothetical protein
MKARYKRYLLLAAFVTMVALLVAVGCAPQAAEPNGGDQAGDDTPGPEITLPEWTIESDCASCHVAEAVSATVASTVYSAHAAEPGVTCITCHTDDDGGLTRGHESYATAGQPLRLKYSNVTDQACLASGCHDQADLSEATAASTVLTDSAGTVVNPHDIPQTTTHVNNIECSSCHKLHSPASSLDASSESLCDSCHHEHVYECNTCHQ